MPRVPACRLRNGRRCSRDISQRSPASTIVLGDLHRSPSHEVGAVDAIAARTPVALCFDSRCSHDECTPESFRTFCPPNAIAAHLSASPRLPRAQRTQSAPREAARPPGQRTGRGRVQRLVGRLDYQHAASSCAPQARHLRNRRIGVAGAQHCARRAFRARRSAAFRPRRPLAQQSRLEVVLERPRNWHYGSVSRRRPARKVRRSL